MAVVECSKDALEKQPDCIVIDKELLSPKRWEAIFQCKQEFLQSGKGDLLKYPWMDKEVVASWMRVRNLGVDPHAVVTSPNISMDRLTEIIRQNGLLINLTKTLVQSFREFIVSSGYIFYLFDTSGVILLNEGDWNNFPPFSAYHSRIGIVSNEHSEGTTAHDLCVRLRQPVQLVGPEHYCSAFQNSIASAVPVKNEAGEVQAALAMVSKPMLQADERAVQDACMHSLGLLVSMAAAIETELKLKNVENKMQDVCRKNAAFSKELQTTKHKLTSAYSALQATLDAMDDSIVKISMEGNILQINTMAARTLNLKPEEAVGKNIGKFFEGKNRLMEFVEKGRNAALEIAFSFGDEKQLYQVDVRPVFHPVTEAADGAVLRISRAEKSSSGNVVRTGGAAVYTFEHIISENEAFDRNKLLARRFAHSAENILLIGESGTGKELYAQAIHNEKCPQGPFMAVNCAAMPRELIESELFGYEGGSFTGAERSGRPGKIELAHGGTLFLDEIGDMPLELQAVLLRTLEDKQVMRIGGSRYRQVDFRVVAATNKNLYAMVKEKQFREDLYFRLAVLTVNIPPLRERGNDVLRLSQFFVDQYCQKQGWQQIKIGSAAQKKIFEYQWPGNVRQLRNAMIYAANTAEGSMIKPENLPNYILLETCPIPVEVNGTSEKSVNEMLCLENLEKAAIETALAYASNYVPEAAEMLGISRSTLYRKLKDYNIEY